MKGWSEMDLKEFHESGLLWQVNQSVLWPLGLALTVELDKDTDPPTYTRLYVQRVDPADAIVDGATPEERVSKANRLLAWMKERFA